MTVAELLARISSAELSEWMAFGRLEPFAGDTKYLGHAIVASVVANSNRGKGKAAKVEDFMPSFKKQAQTIEEQLAIAKMYTAAMPQKEDK